MSIAQSWLIKTAAAKPRSVQLQAVDASVTTVVQNGPGVADANLKNLAAKLHAWKLALPAEYNKLKVQADELFAFAKSQYRRGKRQIDTGASKLSPVGYRLYVPGDPEYELDGDTFLPAPQRVPALTSVQIQQINEAIRRTKLAVEAARDLVIPIASKNALGPDVFSRSERLFLDYFGRFDQARAQTVLKNYNTLCVALGGAGPIIFDHRNTDFGEDCYAACKRGNVTANVKIWFGRDFFSPFRAGSKGAYRNTSDSTVGTLVHEFSHGSCNAVDAPPVLDNGNWRLPPDPVTWESPDNNIQSSTPDLDIKLARKEPRAAIVNADNYGQFATTAMLWKSA